MLLRESVDPIAGRGSEGSDLGKRSPYRGLTLDTSEFVPVRQIVLALPPVRSKAATYAEFVRLP